MITMCCWMKFSDSHGLVGYEPIWLEAGDKPEVDVHKFLRVPSQDFTMEGERWRVSDALREAKEEAKK